MRRIVLWSAVFLLASQFARAEESMKIDVTSDPPLPAQNLVKNAGFEEELASWSGSSPETAAAEGWDVKSSDEAYKGNHSVYIKVEPRARQRSRGIYQSMTSLVASGKIVPGKSYVISCFMKSKGVSNAGGEYCGAGVHFNIYSSDWKQGAGIHAKGGDTKSGWINIVSKPLECPEWGKKSDFGVAISYTSGEAWIDEVCLAEAFTDLHIKASGPGILQVVVENEKGENIFDSGRLPDGTGEFSKSLKVLSVYRYKIRVVDKDGEIHEKAYPGT